MNPLGACLLLIGAWAAAAQPPSRILVDYPRDGSIFPPEITAPLFLWRDATPGATLWRIEVAFGDRTRPIRVESQGEPLRIGEIDPRAVADTNELPQLTPEQAEARTWRPDAETWANIKKRSTGRRATVTITGWRGKGGAPVSRGQVTIETSKDPVGAPIFYRDVPLMPSETEKGVIKPLARAGIPLIAWRLRNVGEPSSRLLMTGLHTCANCHSFSLDGKTMGMDLDGPRNDKGMYALAPVKPEMSIGDEDVVKWTSFLGRQKGDLRIGFMSQVSPDGRHVVTMVNGWGAGESNGATNPARRRSGKEMIGNFYVANFKNYGFLQVFYPTGGILAWYDRTAATMHPLPGADDPRYVHTNAVWSPDGKYIVFARAEARAAYPEDRPLAEYANDPNETPIQYDLYRIPFNGGKGGPAEPIAGASANGMSNSFPKVSPDGRWVVYVQARNGQLMRPDSELYIVPFQGGKARRMNANTARMNSWHSFSPNGRWLAFSSKERSPYTQLYLTHVDENGRDSPAILVENTTAANRAVNIPEFVNIPSDGLLKIATPAVEFYRLFDAAWELAQKGEYEAAIPAWKRALAAAPEDARVRMNLGMALARTGKLDQGIVEYRKAIEIDPAYPEAHMNLGVALAESGRIDEAIGQYNEALRNDPEYPEAHSNLGAALASQGKLDEAIEHYRRALDENPRYPEVHSNLGVALARSGKLDEAIRHFQVAVEENPNSAEFLSNLARAWAKTGRIDEGIAYLEKLAEAHPGSAELQNSLGVAMVWRRRADDAVARFEEAVRLTPEFADAHYNLGETLYYLKGDAAEALAHWRAVLRTQPNHLPALDQAARVLATSPEDALRDGAEAVALAERAVKLSGGREPAVLDTLGAAYAEAGRFSEAVETARRAAALAVDGNKQALAETLNSRIALYQSGTPLRTRQPAASSSRP
ncbi:MAG: tetratricopeptide repeat protein [Bryobacteraceae bacterium]|nr:tetratricopeptide repeat protein [Bryobacteraceae bacterium]